MDGNMFFEQNGRKLYGNQFGYALQYALTKDAFRIAHVRFVEGLIMPDDPQNWNRPNSTDFVSECLFELAKKEKNVLAYLYGFWVEFDAGETIYEIKTKIQKIQWSLIEINPNVPVEVKHYLENGLRNLVKEMPVG